MTSTVHSVTSPPLPPLPVVVLDACVLYPAPLRDFLMRLATANLFQARWSEVIHEEWIRNLLINRPDLTRVQLERTKALMNRAVPNANVTGHEALISTLTLPDPDDRHVLAIAIKSASSQIVTFNLRDFPSQALAPYGVAPVSPDVFATCLYESYPEEFLTQIRRHRASLKNPPKSVEKYLGTLRQNQLPTVAERLAGQDI